MTDTPQGIDNPTADISLSTSEGQGKEVIAILTSQIDTLWQDITTVTEGDVHALIFFGSRLDPNRLPRFESDLDYASIVNDSSPLQQREDIKQRTNSVIGRIGYKPQCHGAFPEGNIPYFNKGEHSIWEDLIGNPTLDNVYLSGNPGTVAKLKESFSSYLTSTYGKGDTKPRWFPRKKR